MLVLPWHARDAFGGRARVLSIYAAIAVLVATTQDPLRAQSDVSGGAPQAKTDEAVLADLLQAPMPVSEIGLKLAAFTLRDPASEKLRLLIVAEIDRSANPEGRLALGYAVSDEKGGVVARQTDRDVKAPVQPTSKLQTYTDFILSDASGSHTLKVAVVDDSGRRGSVEHTFRPS